MKAVKRRSKPKTKRAPAKELQALRRRIARLRTLAVAYENAQATHARLATFPEQNPNMVIETDLDGRVTYLNPVAQSRFPDLWEQGASHPLLVDLRSIIRSFQDGNDAYVAREIDVEQEAFEQKICYAKDAGAVRILVYVHDITRRKRAEESIQKLAKQVVYAQEEERHRLSRELHDEAGQALTALKLSLELILADLGQDALALRQNLSEAISLTESTKERIRVLAQGLRPPALDTVGLNLTLESFCRDFSRRTQLPIRYQGSDVSGLPDAVNICLYRVLQEALTNVAKHAKATQVDVQLSREGHLVRLAVADNGRGFSHDATKMLQRWTGIGLLGMRERVEMLGGWLEIETELGRGLRTVANLPVNQLS